MELGAPTEFVIEPGGRRYRAFVSDTAGESFEADGTWHMSGILPADFSFVAVTGMLSAAGRSATGGSATLPTGALAVTFEAGGTAVDAAFDVVDSESHRVRLSIRGLTGAVDISGIRTGVGR